MLIGLILILVGLIVCGYRALQAISDWQAEPLSVKTFVPGAGLVIAGVLIWGAAESRRIASESAARQATLERRQASAVYNAYPGQIAEWEAAADTEPQRVQLGGDDGSEVIYGRCADGDFYVYVFDYPQSETHNRRIPGTRRGRTSITTDDFAYIPETSPSFCSPEGLNVREYFPLPGISGWYGIRTLNTPEEIISGET